MRPGRCGQSPCPLRGPYRELSADEWGHVLTYHRDCVVTGPNGSPAITAALLALAAVTHPLPEAAPPKPVPHDDPRELVMWIVGLFVLMVLFVTIGAVVAPR